MSEYLLDNELSVEIGENVTEIKKSKILKEKSLMKAALKGDHEEIVTLLNSGASVDAEEYNKLLCYALKNYLTPLQLAAIPGHYKCMQVLIDHGADINAKDFFSVTALHIAAHKGHYACLKVLLHAGADASVPMQYFYFGDLKPSNLTRYMVVSYLKGTTPLHLAAKSNHVDCVKELIWHGADYNAVDECGRTSLYVAAQTGHRKCLLAHLKYANGREILSLPSYNTGDTPLHFAVKSCMTDCVKELLKFGSDVNHRNFYKHSPLDLVLRLPNRKRQLEILKLFILKAYNIDINKLDFLGLTPLHHVCLNGSRQPEIAKFLMAYGANADIEVDGSTLLERELKYDDDDFEILKCVVKRMLHLPQLKCLNICQCRGCTLSHKRRHHHHPEENILRNRQLLDSYNMDAEAIPVHVDLLSEEMRPNMPQSLIEAIPVRYPSVEDLFDEIQNDDEEVEVSAHRVSPFALKRQLWYEQIASTPRTLQHCCRFVIRDVLGPSKLKHIGKLPIPKILQCFLLFKLKE